MKKIWFLLTAIMMISVTEVSAQQAISHTALPVGAVFTQSARDWHNFHKFHEHVEEAIHEVEIARGADHHGTAGPGKKADNFLRNAEKELRLANDSTNSGH